jgi:hypothetical protein
MPWVSVVETYKRSPAATKEVEQVIEYRRRNAKVKFYVDENFPRLATEITRANGFHALTAQRANMDGHPDENHAAYALKHKRILLTCDRDYLDERRFPLIHCPVIVVCNFGAGSLADLRLTFRCLRTMSRFPQFYDKWTKIDAQRNSWIEYSRFLNGTTSRTRYRLYGVELQEWLD